MGWLKDTALTELYTLVRVTVDRRTPLRVRALLVLTAIYVVVPIDLFTDVVPVLGWGDDVLLGVVARYAVYRSVPPTIIEEHREAARSHLLVAVALLVAVGLMLTLLILRWLGII